MADFVFNVIGLSIFVGTMANMYVYLTNPLIVESLDTSGWTYDADDWNHLSCVICKRVFPKPEKTSKQSRRTYCWDCQFN